MSRHLFFTETAKDEYLKLDSTLRERCAAIIKSFKKNPFQGFELQGEMAAYRCVHIMRYRMVFLVENEKVIVCGITRRANIYAHLGRNIMQLPY